MKTIFVEFYCIITAIKKYLRNLDEGIVESQHFKDDRVSIKKIEWGFERL